MLRNVLAFASVGAFITICSAFSYWVLSGPFNIDPNISLLAVFIVFTAIGHFLHGSISFREKTGGKVSSGSLWRFGAVNIAGFSLNQLFIFAMVKIQHWPDWTPILPMILVTPVLVFVLGRYWVFDHEQRAF